jgi:histidinol-phosphate/aromatic aminotransferase/cobyric acid decarboxylase-like protein
VLGVDRDWVRERIADVRENRQRLLNELRQRDHAVFDSAANFLLVRVRNAMDAAAVLRSRGVAVRAFAALPGVGDCLRISIGPWPMIERFLNAFDQGGWT